MYKVIEFTDEEELEEKFLALPSKLYKKNEITNSKEEEKKVLRGTHPLSHYFSIRKFILIDENKEAKARIVITTYPEDENAYLGFFECVEDYEISHEILTFAFNTVKEMGYKSVIGPFNSSIWIGYRFKVDHFDRRPYFAEPYNKEYYSKMFKDEGFEIYEEYSSNAFSPCPKDYFSEKYQKRLTQMKEKGYEFRTTDKEHFAKDLKDVYKLIMELYSHFPGFKKISENEFLALYDGLSGIIKFDMVKLAFYNGEMVGFFVNVPNYHNAISQMNIFEILKIKFFPKEYILLYLGAKKEHLGIGSALAELVKEELKHNRASSIGALIKKGNANKAYFKELIEKEYNYELLIKKLD